MQLQEKHSVRLDSSQEVQEVLLAEGAADWRIATKRHEEEAAQFGGVVANPGSRRSMGKGFCAHTTKSSSCCPHLPRDAHSPI